MPTTSLAPGSTSVILPVFLQDSSSSTGAGLNTLVWNTSGLTCWYKRSSGAVSVAITLASTGVLGTYTEGGFSPIDTTHMPGLYELHPPDDALAAGADWVCFFFTGATNLADTPLLVQLGGAGGGGDLSGVLAAVETDLPAQIAALNDLAPEDVLEQVQNALAMDSYSEPGAGTPPAATTLAAKISYLYKAWRNNVEQTASQYKLFNADGVTVDHKAAVADDGTTFTRSQIVGGP